MRGDKGVGMKRRADAMDYGGPPKMGGGPPHWGGRGGGGGGGPPPSGLGGMGGPGGGLGGPQGGGMGGPGGPPFGRGGPGPKVGPPPFGRGGPPGGGGAMGGPGMSPGEYSRGGPMSSPGGPPPGGGRSGGGPIGRGGPGPSGPPGMGGGMGGGSGPGAPGSGGASPMMGGKLGSGPVGPVPKVGGGMGPGMGGGPPHLEAGKWRSAIAALSGRGMPGRNPQETLDFALTDKKKLTDLCLEVVARYERLSDDTERMSKSHGPMRADLDKIGHENLELRSKIKDSERLSQQAHDLLNRTANELTQVTEERNEGRKKIADLQMQLEEAKNAQFQQVQDQRKAEYQRQLQMQQTQQAVYGTPAAGEYLQGGYNQQQQQQGYQQPGQPQPQPAPAAPAAATAAATAGSGGDEKDYTAEWQAYFAQLSQQNSGATPGINTGTYNPQQASMDQGSQQNNYANAYTANPAQQTQQTGYNYSSQSPAQPAAPSPLQGGQGAYIYAQPGQTPPVPTAQGGQAGWNQGQTGQQAGYGQQAYQPGNSWDQQQAGYGQSGNNYNINVPPPAFAGYGGGPDNKRGRFN